MDRTPTDHLDVLGRLHLVWGAFGVLTGASLAVLAAGTAVALTQRGEAGRAEDAAIWVFAAGALLLGGGGAATLAIGRSLRRRRASSRTAALALAAINLVIVPFGTALAGYTFWVLQHEDARRAFSPASGAGVADRMNG